MYKARLVVGSKLGRLQVVAIHSDDEWISWDSDGIEERTYEDIYEFKCDCGNPFKLPVSQFESKRKLLDCGCGLSVNEPVGMKLVTFHMTTSMDRQVKLKSLERGITKAMFMRNCIQAGLDNRIIKREGEL